MRFLTRLPPLLLLLPLFPPTATAEVFVNGFVAARGLYADGPSPWLTGGFGESPSGGDAAEEFDLAGFGDAQITVLWEPNLYFGAYVHAAARAEPEVVGGREIGVVEAYLEGRLYFTAADAPPEQPPGEFRLRLGQLFLNSSMENVDPLWSSSYTLSFSAINSWIGEELRPLGLDAEYAWSRGNNRFAAGATLFGGNDTLGTLLAWRGWALGSRLAVTGETLPLPPLLSLRDPALFGRFQRSDGTEPIGDDLDGRLGWGVRGRWSRDFGGAPEGANRFTLRLSALDNRGDRDLHRDEYAWRTRFVLLGAKLEWGDGWTLAGEYLRGDTGMGFILPDDPAKVDADLAAGYLLLSYGQDRYRFTLRHDRFETEERDGSAAENNSGDGDAWTAAVFFFPRPDLRLGLEVLRLDSDRAAVRDAGFDGATGGTTVSVEVRWLF
jgi:hypothetical protein